MPCDIGGVVQNGFHSGTLRAMSDPVPTNNSKLSSGKSGQDAASGKKRVVEKAALTPKRKTGRAGEFEIGGPEGPEPTRFGDWERKGRCIDF